MTTLPLLISVTLHFYDLMMLLVIILLLCVSAIVSGAETAAFSLSPHDFNHIKSEKSDKYSALRSILDTPKRLLATILIVNNLVNVAIVIFSTFLIHSVFDFQAHGLWAFLIQVVVISFLILLFGEIIPKIYASQNSLKTITFLAPFIKGLMWLVYPFAFVLVRSTSIVDKRLSKKIRNISIDELSDVIDITTGESNSMQESKMLKGIVNFGDIEVHEIQRARTDIVAADITITFKQLMEIILESGYSRIPIYEKSLDKIVGILHIKDLLPYLSESDDFEWSKLVRPALFVPESKKIDKLFDEFQKKKIHIAIVVDEYGGTSGIITLEDVLEEILGDINDEFDMDSDEAGYEKINDTTYIFDAKFKLVDFCRIMHIENDFFDDVKGESETLAGLVLEYTGKFPAKGDVINVKNFKFIIQRVDHRRIRSIKIECKN